MQDPTRNTHRVHAASSRDLIDGQVRYAWLERTWVLQQLPVALLLYARGGWGFVVWGVCARVTTGILGECWHNNHHTFPGSARLGLYKGEWDPGWWLLCGLRRLGLVWALPCPPICRRGPN